MSEQLYRLVMTDHEEIEPEGWEFGLGRMNPHISPAAGWMVPVEVEVDRVFDFTNSPANRQLEITVYPAKWRVIAYRIDEAVSDE